MTGADPGAVFIRPQTQHGAPVDAKTLLSALDRLLEPLPSGATHERVQTDDSEEYDEGFPDVDGTWVSWDEISIPGTKLDHGSAGRELPASLPFGYGYGNKRLRATVPDSVGRLIPAIPGVDGAGPENPDPLRPDRFDPGLAGTTVDGWSEWWPEAAQPSWVIDGGHIIRGGPRLRDRSISRTGLERELERRREQHVLAVHGWVKERTREELEAAWEKNRFLTARLIRIAQVVDRELAQVRVDLHKEALKLSRPCANPQCPNRLFAYDSRRQARYCGELECNRSRARQRDQKRRQMQEKRF